MPVDMPTMTPSALSYLCRQYELMDGYSLYRLPSSGFVNGIATARNVIDTAMNSNDPKICPVALVSTAKYPDYSIYVGYIANFGNANTPEQWQQLVSQSKLSS